MAKITTTKKSYIRVSKTEYAQLKKLQDYFEGFLDYIEHIRDIRKARQNIKDKKVIFQDNVIKELGL